MYGIPPTAGYEDFNPNLDGYREKASDSRMVDETIVRMTTEGGCVDLATYIPGLNINEDLEWFNPYWEEVDEDGNPLSGILTAEEMIGNTLERWRELAAEANR